MLKSPYPPPHEVNDREACRFQTYIDAGDRNLLMSLRAVRGTAQAAINNLILNLCNDLRDLKITGYRPDADDILTILVERRPFTDEQIARLRCTTIGVSTEIPTGLQQSSRSTGVHKGATSHTTVGTDAQSDAKGRVGRNSKGASSKKPKTTKSQKASNVRRGHTK